MDSATMTKLCNMIKEAVDIKDFQTFDLFEQFSIVEMVKRGQSFNNALQIYVNMVEGDGTQLSKNIKKACKARGIKWTII